MILLLKVMAWWFCNTNQPGHSYFIYIWIQKMELETNAPEYYQPSIQATSDGSATLVHPILGELYHSRHGAWTESHHIFIGHGLLPFLEGNPQSVHIFEMGFGSGLNATLVREVADREKVPISYTSVESYPVERTVVEEMEMPEQTREERERWLELHLAAWDLEVEISPYFKIQKMKASFPEVNVPGSGLFNLIFYDAFAPAAQPELWSVSAMSKCYEMLAKDGMWLSYCAKGQVRRNLKEAGFEVEALPGPPGKREITRGVRRK